MTASIPPGWYEDPSSPGSERWWDGAQWTASTRARASSEIPPPPPGMPPGGAVGPVSGYPQAGYQPGPYQPGSYPPGGAYGPPGPRRGKTIGLSVLALVVVGALVAVLIVVLGGNDDKQGVATDGRATDRATGLSVPKFKGWVAKDPDSPADQYFTRPCPSGGPSSGATSDSDTESASSSSDSSDDEDADCYRAGLAVVTESADTFDDLIADLKKDIVKKSSKVTVVDTELDKRVDVDGHRGYVLRVKVRGTPKDLEMDSDTAWAQIVAIDEKDEDGEYPCVVIKLENSAKAPDKSVLDAILKGIRVGTPTPTESGS
ncbi:DUF2510 domain-containing protein [Streptomyces sp. SID3343]|uniref:DUF2510 domain-containing protein n=1 Tax=Streptomyces sp. SID3343 TaxID=2690260 RepID=UPI001370D54E|nr:DUF2510 domain-containing protein [Streptomyces sp. SID3343]